MAHDAEKVVADRPVRRLRFIVAGAVAVVAMLIVLLVVPVYSTLQPAYYARYPQLRVRMDHWRTSTHARIPCAGCHVNPGISGLVSFASRAVPAFYSQLIYGPGPTNLLQVPGRQACQKCHTSYRQVSASGDLLIPHRAHVEVLQVNCPVCHKNLVHSPNTQGFNSPEMTTCLSQCHDGKRATVLCVKCHTRKNVPESHRRKDWLLVHSKMVKSIDCGQCHAWSPDYCGQCHAKRPASHTSTWRNDHQFRVKALGEKGCMTCHDKKFCQTCHD